jgi:hypothetical protein
LSVDDDHARVALVAVRATCVTSDGTVGLEVSRHDPVETTARDGSDERFPAASNAVTETV